MVRDGPLDPSPCASTHGAFRFGPRGTVVGLYNATGELVGWIDHGLEDHLPAPAAGGEAGDAGTRRPTSGSEGPAMP